MRELVDTMTAAVNPGDSRPPADGILSSSVPCLGSQS